MGPVNWGDVPTWLAVFGGAAAAGAALWQLRLQRIQLTGQTRVQEREQANAIHIAARSIDGTKAGVLPLDKSEPVHLLVVANNSKRPIREVACKIDEILADRTIRHEETADCYGELAPDVLSPESPGVFFLAHAWASSMPVLSAGHAVGFAWAFPAAQYARLQSWVRFTDDAGLHWEITTNLHLARLASRDW